VSSQATGLADTLAQDANLRSAVLNVAAGDDSSFFEWTPP